MKNAKNGFCVDYRDDDDRDDDNMMMMIMMMMMMMTTTTTTTMTMIFLQDVVLPHCTYRSLLMSSSCVADTSLHLYITSSVLFVTVSFSTCPFHLLDHLLHLLDFRTDSIYNRVMSCFPYRTSEL